MRHAAAIAPPGCAATPDATRGAATAYAETRPGNLDKSDDGNPSVTASSDLAQPPTAGTNANGYELTAIEVRFGTIPGTL